MSRTAGGKHKLRCDLCGRIYRGSASTFGFTVARQMARDLGWATLGDRDACHKCIWSGPEIKEAVPGCKGCHVRRSHFMDALREIDALRAKLSEYRIDVRGHAIEIRPGIGMTCNLCGDRWWRGDGERHGEGCPAAPDTEDTRTPVSDDQ